MRDTQAPGARRRALVADDDPVTRMVIVAALQEMGLNAEEAEDGAAALEAARREIPDLFVLDVQMPHLDGFETCAAIRGMPGGQDVPILIVTGRDDLPCIERAFEVGATDFVTKPINTPLLQHRIRFQMRASRAFHEVSDTLAELRTSQRHLDKSQQLARLGDWEWNVETDRLILSARAIGILDCASDPPSSPGDLLARCVHPEDLGTAEKSFQEARQASKNVQFDHRLRDGEHVVHHFLEADEALPGEGLTVTGTVQDITERKRAEERIRQLAFYDSLTGLPNRRLLEDRLTRALEWAKRSETRVGFLFIDLDRFKRVNDTLGHTAGDQILRQVAERLLSSVRSGDSLGRAPQSRAAETSVSRLGGDEFAVVLSNLRDAQDAGRVAQRLLENLRHPLAIQQQEVTVAASVGIAIYPTDGDDSASLFQKADMAMHHAKKKGRDNHQFFTASMNDAALRAMHIESSLREAMEQDRMELHYQPLVRCDSGEIIGAEALVRMRDADGSLVPPDAFIPIAEESGLIITLGAWVLRAAFGQLALWQAEGWESARISVNISAHQLRRKSFLHLVKGALHQAGVDLRSVELEVTESVFMEERGVKALQELKEMGFSIAIDDFGTGFSSLSYLSRMPADVLKIDRAFISDIDKGGAPIVAAIIAMAHKLGCSVVAEGVETEQEVDFLREHGCDVLQGYHFGRPVPAEELRWQGPRD
jgi:diguanylate cyclase (GGDEF)-like protein